jgi:hypothetical protein
VVEAAGIQTPAAATRTFSFQVVLCQYPSWVESLTFSGELPDGPGRDRCRSSARMPARESA